MDTSKPQNTAEAMIWGPPPGTPEPPVAASDQERIDTAERAHQAGFGLLVLLAGIFALWWGFSEMRPKMMFYGVFGTVCGPVLILRWLVNRGRDA